MKNTDNTIIMVRNNNDDWEGLYINGKLIAQNHMIDVIREIENYTNNEENEDLNIVKCFSFEVDFEELDISDYPEKIVDLVRNPKDLRFN